MKRKADLRILRISITAFSLVEVLISMSILSILLILLFATVGTTTRMFQDTTVRQTTESQLRSIKLLMERDFELTDFWTINTVERVTPDGARDAVAMGALSNWDSTTRFDPVTGRPLWDRYAVWYATQEADGKLIRQTIEASTPIDSPYVNLSTNLNDIDPSTNLNVLHSRIVSRRVKNFRVTPRLQNGTVRVSVKLQGKGAGRPNSMERTKSNLELSLTFRPLNSWPKI